MIPNDYYKIKLDYQTRQEQTGKFHLTLLIACTVSIFALITQTKIGSSFSKPDLVLLGVLYALFILIVSISWLQQVYSLISNENAHINYLKKSSEEMADYFEYTDQHIKKDRKDKKNKSRCWIVPLNQINDAIPKVILQIISILFCVVFLVMVSMSIDNLLS